MTKKGKPEKKPKKKGVNKKIRKSDDIIVIAKTPIEQIISQTAVAKEIRDAVKKISSKDKLTLDRKVRQIKPNQQDFRDIYTGLGRQPPYKPKSFYKSGYNVKDNSELFQWTEYQEAVRKTQEAVESDSLAHRDVVMEKDLMQYLSNFMLNQFTGQDMNDIPFEQKEKMFYYSMFNREWIMMKVNLLGFGEKTYHANPPPNITVINHKKEKEVEK